MLESRISERPLNGVEEEKPIFLFVFEVLAVRVLLLLFLLLCKNRTFTVVIILEFIINKIEKLITTLIHHSISV